MKAENAVSLKHSELAQSTTMEKVRGTEKQLLPGVQTSPSEMCFLFRLSPVNLPRCRFLGHHVYVPSQHSRRQQPESCGGRGRGRGRHQWVFFSARYSGFVLLLTTPLNRLCFKARAARPHPPPWSATQPPVPSSLGVRPPSTSPRAAPAWASALWAAATLCW